MVKETPGRRTINLSDPAHTSLGELTLEAKSIKGSVVYKHEIVTGLINEARNNPKLLRKVLAALK